MGNELLASKIVVIEEAPRVRAAQSSSTSILGAVGVAERGPIGEATLVTSWEEYTRIFGGFVAGADLPTAMYSFFRNGGSTAYVVRTVKYTDVNVSAAHGATSASAELDDASSALSVTVKGKTEGVYANSLKVRVSPASSGEATEFNLSVLKGGFVVESYANVSVVAGHERHVAGVVNNASDLIQVVVAAGAARPADVAEVALTGGADGTAGIADADFIGASSTGTGLYALDAVPDLSLVIVPGLSTPASAQAIVNYCETYRGGDAFPILDCPAGVSANSMVAHVRDASNPLYNYSEFGAVYWPRYKISNPSPTVLGNGASTITVPPSGGVAGVYARNDARRPGGVYTAPAGVEEGVLLDAVGLEKPEVLRESVRDLIYPKRINPICSFPGAPIHLDGSRTLKGNGNFPSIPERRGVIKIARDLKALLLPFKHKPHTAALREAIRRSIDNYLTLQTKDGAFSSNEPSSAYFVDVSEALNTPSVVASNKVLIRVGLATAKPSEFIVLQLSQDTRALEAELA